MINRIILFLLVLFSNSIKAQVPNFGTTAGDQKLYGYSVMKYRAKTKT